MDLTVRQATDKAIIDWDGFSIAKGATVSFENGKDGATLNRVKGTSASVIDGLMKGEGSVYLINRNGIVVGKTGVIDVGGRFVGSTQDLDNAKFLAGGDLALAGASEAPIVNYGKIGSLGGDVALVAAKVTNEGEISAVKGSAGLLAGYQVLLRDQSQSNGKFSVVVGGAGTSATNLGAITAAEAELRAQGGNIYALAGNTGGVINAQGVSRKDGRIFLTAEGGEARISGTLTARKADGAGGAIEATAKNVLLDSGATLDASGTTGGTVLVGGDWQGGAAADLRIADHDIARANAVVMADTAKIDVSGSAGAGGKAVLWSDDYTNFLGTIDAGGATDGGRVETSSKGLLMALGLVNAAAGTGRAGEWLLDPSDIVITAGTGGGGFDGGSPNTFTPSAGATSSQANVGTIVTSLNAGTSVTITTTSTGAGNGDITVSSAISKTSGGTATLTLLADRNILVNRAISSSSNALNVILNSRSSGGASGYVNVAAAITTNGGNLQIVGGAMPNERAIGSGSTAGVTIGGAINTGTGSLYVLGGSGSGSAVGISVASTITTTSGNISLDGQSANSHGVEIQGVAIKTTTGTTSIVGEALASGIGINLLEGVSINNDAATTAGNVSVLGKSNTGTGLIFRGGTFKSAGLLTLSGISNSFGGIFRSSSNATVMSGDGGLSLIGRIENTISSAVPANTGIFLGGTGAVSLTAKSSDTSKSPLMKIEAKSDYSGFVVGDGNGVAALTIDAGRGGLTVTTTGQGQGGWGFRAPIADSGSTSITSAGAITFNTSSSIEIGGKLTQTLGLDSTLTSAGAIFLRDVVTTSGASDLTIDAKGLVKAAGNVTAEGALTVKGQLGVDAPTAAFTAKTDALNISATPTSGAYDIATANLKAATTLTVDGSKNVTTGTIDVTGPDGGAIALTSKATLSTQAITTASGTGNIDVTATNDLSLASISKTGTGASALMVKSYGSITMANAISSTGGKLDVTLNSRANSAPDTDTGIINATGAITTAGGFVTLRGGSSSADMYARGGTSGAVASTGTITTSGGNVSIYGVGDANAGINLQSTIVAAGGNILLDGKSTSGKGINLTTPSVTTSGTGTITFTGVSGSGVGIDFPFTTAISTTGTGKLSFTGTSTSGLGLGLYAGTYSSDGVVEFIGTSTTGGGILRNSTDVTSITGKGGLTLTGKVLGPLTSGSTTNTGIWFAGRGAVNLTSTSTDATKTPLMDISAQSDYLGFIVGDSSNAGALTINAGTGGLKVTTTGAGLGGFGYRTFTPSTGAHAITSAGAITFNTSASLQHRGNITQTAGGASTIQSDGAIFLYGTTTTEGADALTVDAAGSLSATGAITAQKSLTVKAPLGVDVLDLTAKAGAIDVSAIRSTNPQNLTTGALKATTTVKVDGSKDVSVGTIDVTTSSGGAISVTSKGAFTVGAINTSSGTGNIDLTGVGDITLAAITKSGTGASALTVKSDGSVTAPSAIQTSNGKLDVTLNSRASSTGDAGIGFVNVGGAITTRGGDVLIRGGLISQTADMNAIHGSTAVAVGGAITTLGGKVSIYGKGGTVAGVTVSSAIDTKGGAGNILIKGEASSGVGTKITTTTLETNSGATIDISGTSASGIGLSLIDGLQINGSNAATGTGDVKLTGTSTSYHGILFAGGTYKSDGLLTILGTSQTGSGVMLQADSPPAPPTPLYITGRGGITMTGKSTAESGGGLVLDRGTLSRYVVLDGTSTNTSAAPKITLTGQGTRNSAIVSYSKLDIKAGAGGFEIKDVSNSTGGLYFESSNYNNFGAITTDGAFSITGKGDVYFGNTSITQNKGGAIPR